MIMMMTMRVAFYDVVLMEHICLKRYSITKKSCLKMFEGVLKRNSGNVMHSKHYNTVCYQAVYYAIVYMYLYRIYLVDLRHIPTMSCWPYY